MTKKYELTDITQVLDGATLYRIRALKDFKDVHVGDLGGWVSSPNNLSQEGDCWVYDNARMYNNSCVFDNARMYDDSCMFDNSHIHDNSSMYGDSHIHDDSHMFDNPRMCGSSSMRDDSHMCGSSSMYDNTQMWDEAFMCGSSSIHNSATAYGDVIIDDSIMYDDSSICGDSNIRNVSLYKEVNLNNLSIEPSIQLHIKKTPIIIPSHPFTVIATDDNLIIGCEAYILGKWKSFNDDEILNMVNGDAKLLKIWNLNKENIFRIAESHQTED